MKTKQGPVSAKNSYNAFLSTSFGFSCWQHRWHFWATPEGITSHCSGRKTPSWDVNEKLVTSHTFPTLSVVVSRDLDLPTWTWGRQTGRGKFEKSLANLCKTLFTGLSFYFGHIWVCFCSWCWPSTGLWKPFCHFAKVDNAAERPGLARRDHHQQQRRRVLSIPERATQRRPKPASSHGVGRLSSRW